MALVLATAGLAGCGDGASASGAPPTALLEVKPDEYCRPGQQITLDGSGSTDPDDDITGFRFTVSDGTAVRTIAERSVSHVCRVQGYIEVLLEVRDSAGNVGQDRVVVSVRPD